MFRHLAPAGSPVTAVDLARWAAAAATSDLEAALEAAIRQLVGTPHVFLTVTGRAGMTVLLRAMRRLAPERTEVVVPAYTCYSVAASVIKAGLTPRIVDIDPSSLDYAPEELERSDFSRVLALVATNLYGLPNDLPRLARFAAARGVFLIDDAAQALGATVGGRMSGTWGDAGLFSFDKGKNVSAIDGGVLVTGSDALATVLDEEVRKLPLSSSRASAELVAKALVYFALLRPWLYWIPNSIPQLQLGTTVFTTDFPLARPRRPQMALALTMLPHLAEFTAARRARAERLLEGVRGVPYVSPITPVPTGTPVYLRLPLLAADEESRNALVRHLNESGIGATGSYPRSIAELPGIQPAPGARPIEAAIDVARRILTLPTHPFVTASDAASMVAALAGADAAGDTGAPRRPVREPVSR